MNAWIAASLVFLAVGSATVALVLIVEGTRGWSRQRKVQERVSELIDGVARDADDGGLFRAAERQPSVLETMIARFPRFANLPEMFENAGLQWTVSTFVLLTTGAAIGGFLAGLLLPGGPLVAAILGVVAGWIPYMVVKVRRSRRLARFEEGFPESIDMLGRAIRAGHPLSAGIQMVGQEMGDPVGAEFRRLFEEQRFGVPFSDALMGLVDRVDLVDVRIFATAILVQREVGGNLAEILDNISTMIRSRFKIRRQLRTYTAQGRLSGVIVGVMPFVVAAAFYALNPDYIGVLFEHPLGRLLLAVAILFQIFGYIWIRKIVNIEI